MSIPALLSQLEGIVADLVGHSGQMTGAMLKRYIAGALAIGVSAADLAGTFVAGVLLEQFAWGNPIPHFSRHAVLHGADTEYGSAANSLRLILVIDHLQHAVRYVATDRGRHYHVAGCPRLRRRGAPRATFRDAAAASAAGRTPCRVCLAHLPQAHRS